MRFWQFVRNAAAVVFLAIVVGFIIAAIVSQAPMFGAIFAAGAVIALYNIGRTQGTTRIVIQVVAWVALATLLRLELGGWLGLLPIDGFGAAYDSMGRLTGLFATKELNLRFEWEVLYWLVIGGWIYLAVRYELRSRTLLVVTFVLLFLSASCRTAAPLTSKAVRDAVPSDAEAARVVDSMGKKFRGIDGELRRLACEPNTLFEMDDATEKVIVPANCPETAVQRRTHGGLNVGVSAFGTVTVTIVCGNGPDESWEDSPKVQHHIACPSPRAVYFGNLTGKDVPVLIEWRR